MLLLHKTLIRSSLGLAPALADLSIVFFFDGGGSGAKTGGRPQLMALTLAIYHHGLSDQVDHVPEIVEALDIGLEQIGSNHHVFLVEGVGLEVAVEFLEGGVFEVPEVEILDCQVVDQQLGDLDKFSGYLLRLAGSLVP